ncbi:MAG: hypothetical protein JWM85_3159 [Acidimicrobiaceae bacterium]|nr:hypothetical protein [Acidimicrobiaceae bacterium]
MRVRKLGGQYEAGDAAARTEIKHRWVRGKPGASGVKERGRVVEVILKRARADRPDRLCLTQQLDKGGGPVSQGVAFPADVGRSTTCRCGSTPSDVDSTPSIELIVS